MFPTCSKTHEAAFFTKNDKKMIIKKDGRLAFLGPPPPGKSKKMLPPGFESG